MASFGYSREHALSVSVRLPQLRARRRNGEHPEIIDTQAAAEAAI